MVHLAVDILLCVDLVSFALGVCILGVAIYVLAAYSYFLVFFPVSTIYISIGVGAGLILLAFLGCFASMQASRGYKTFLCCYFILVLACLCAQIASIVLFTNMGGLIATQSTLISGSLVAPAEINLNNAVLSSYTACCTGCTPSTCNNPQPYFNKTLANCLDHSVSVCTPAKVCTGNPKEDGCFQGTVTDTPPTVIDPAICQAFSTYVYVNQTFSAPLVGPASKGACGGGSPAHYSDTVFLYFASEIYWVKLGLGVLCGFQALNLFVAAMVLCLEKGNV